MRMYLLEMFYLVSVTKQANFVSSYKSILLKKE